MLQSCAAGSSAHGHADAPEELAAHQPCAPPPCTCPALATTHLLCPLPAACPAETPKELLIGSLITPNDLFYVRNHLPVPHIKPEQYRLRIEGEGLRSVSGCAEFAT